MNESSGFLSYKIGQTPNTAMLFLGYCCCFAFPYFAIMHCFRNELKKAFPEVDDSMHWGYVIISIWGLYVNHVQLTELETKKGIKYTPRVHWMLPLFIPFLWPLAIAENMKRLNTLAADTDAAK